METVSVSTSVSTVTEQIQRRHSVTVTGRTHGTSDVVMTQAVHSALADLAPVRPALGDVLPAVTKVQAVTALAPYDVVQPVGVVPVATAADVSISGDIQSSDVRMQRYAPSDLVPLMSRELVSEYTGGVVTPQSSAACVDSTHMGVADDSRMLVHIPAMPRLDSSVTIMPSFSTPVMSARVNPNIVLQ